jgi:heme-degrading monooxygenase HmoA
MILEVADFRTDDPADFEAGMEEVKGVIASADGYLGHTVQRSVETPGRYLLIVRWASIAHHQAFRTSETFGTWVGRLGPHRDGAFVEHTETVLNNGWDPTA